MTGRRTAARQREPKRGAAGVRPPGRRRPKKEEKKAAGPVYYPLAITMLPADYGDAILVEYGASRRILIDGGPANAYGGVRTSLMERLPESRNVDLFVVTHIDADHIDGAILALKDEGLALRCGDVWFNDWRHLTDTEETREDSFGPLQGEFLGALLKAGRVSWNQAFGGRAVEVPAEGDLPRHVLPDGATITLLSPGRRQLRRLRRNWLSVVNDAGWNPGDEAAALKRLQDRRAYQPDRFDTFRIGGDNAVANGSSIAFVFEYANLRCLFTGDAHADVLDASLQRYERRHPRGTCDLAFDAVKLPHHGSSGNWTEALQRRTQARHYLISTSGARFGHPDEATIQLLSQAHPGPFDVWFNYELTEWCDPRSARRLGYTPHFPEANVRTVTLELS